MYAIVDIETTGGYAANNAITEVAIVLYDGENEISRYERLINPEIDIPVYVQSLTGITNEMVANAPPFESLAEEIFGLLEDAVFVAHNVNFDYSFLHYQLKASGYDLQSKKLCTVRLGRKVFPGFQSYSLGNLCRSLGIDISNRHRAGGDADATVRLFKMILANDHEGHIGLALKGRNKEQYLPENLPAAQLDKLPMMPGVYYFHDQKGKVVYVGKAKNLRKRVCSHFSNNKPNKQKQEFLRNIHSISHQETGTELIAFLLECVEIKKLWPKFNRSLKRFEQAYGLYAFQDRNQYLRLAIEKRKKQLQPVYTFSQLADGQNMLRKLVKRFNLCSRLCFLEFGEDPCVGVLEGICNGACTQEESADVYNQKVEDAIASLHQELPSFGLIDDGRNAFEQSCIMVEKGRVVGMGYIPFDTQISKSSELKDFITAYPENDYMRGLVFQHAARWPAKKILFSSLS